MIELLLNAERIYHPWDVTLSTDYEYVGHGVRVARSERHVRATWPWVHRDRLQYSLNPEPSPVVSDSVYEWWRKSPFPHQGELTGAEFMQVMNQPPRVDFLLAPCACGKRSIVWGDPPQTRAVCICPLSLRSESTRLRQRYTPVPEAPLVDLDLLLNLYNDGFLECLQDSVVQFSWERPTLARGGALMVSIALPEGRFTAATLPTTK